MNNTNFKISSPFLSCFNNLSDLYFEALVSRFWRGLVGIKFLLFHGSEEESVYRILLCQLVSRFVSKILNLLFSASFTTNISVGKNFPSS